MLDSSRHISMASYAERGPDLYSTPPVATQALLRCENIPQVVWEPAAGRGAISDVLIASGRTVFASDLHDYGAPGIRASYDFLSGDNPTPPGIEAIVTNPPYQLAQQFVEEALRRAPYVAMLLRLAFLESERRTAILDHGTLARVHVFKKRLPMMHRDGWNGAKASSAIPFAWFVWERSNTRQTTIDRISH